MSKGALGLLSAYWPEGTARYAHIPLERVTQHGLHRTASAEPERVAVATRGRALPYRELSRDVRAGADVLGRSAAPGERVAVLGADPASVIPAVLAGLEADLCVWIGGAAPPAATLAAFAPALVVASDPPAGFASLAPEALREGDPEASRARPNLRAPVLALAAPGGAGEVLHNHKTLVASAISFGSFFLLEPGAEVLLLDPPGDWLGLAALLAALHKGATIHAAWDDDPAALAGRRCDYAVASWDTLERRFLGPTPALHGPRIGVGALVGIEGPFAVARRRRLARRLRAPVLTVYGRSDLGPAVASHPTWYLDAAAGIPLPNVDVRPLNPADGRSLAIGWDAVDEAEMGIKSALAPAGGALVDGWLRTFRLAQVDPTGLYFLRGEVSRPA